jgi:hypothetical protein
MLAGHEVIVVAAKAESGPRSSHQTRPQLELAIQQPLSSTVQ